MYKIFMTIRQEKVAQCVGLWLAEGDSKTKLEITLTNNCPKIIVFFHNVIDSLVISRNLPRVYVYSPSEDQKPRLPIDVEHKYYVDRRASQPYFIYRISDVQRVKEWKKTIKKFKRKTELYSFILQGFFAGEGNVKFQ